MTIDRSKLGLGGHSYIAALGNDAPADFQEQCRIVGACLDLGMEWFDTTYYQERVALGKILGATGRRDAAKLTAWNFFRQPGGPDDLFPFTPYEPGHIDTMLAELGTGVIDLLVIHAHDDHGRLQDEIGLATRWRDAGKILRIGLGMAEVKHAQLVSDSASGISAVFAPYNVFNRSAGDLFSRMRDHSISTFAMSPFIRGWKLDQPGIEAAAAADLMLRWVTSQEIVDTVIVSMRRLPWVEANIVSERRGALTEDEVGIVSGWLTQA